MKMDILLSTLLIAVGACLAVVTLDFGTRVKLRKDLVKQSKKMEDSISKLNRLHNESAEKMIEIEDKVAAHNYQLTQKVQPQNPFKTRG